jgi:hypothetical protein
VARVTMRGLNPTPAETFTGDRGSVQMGVNLINLFFPISEVSQSIIVLVYEYPAGFCAQHKRR